MGDSCNGTSIREVLEQAIAEIAADEAWDKSRACVILSGGLDSSIAAQLGREQLGLCAAFTVLATPDATDRPHAAAAAMAAGLEQHHVIDVPLADLLGELPTCVRVLGSFDPMQLRNSIAVCRALREAAAAGFTCAVTGDAADELFGGYNFTHNLDDAAWLEQRAKMARVMEFSSTPLGQHFGVHVASPFLHPSVVAAALRLSKSDCVGERGGQRFGKLPLRLACPEVPSCWRAKDPIEVGCGTTALGDRPWQPGAPPGYFHALCPPEQFERLRGEAAAEGGVEIRDVEHLHYYRVFRQVFPDGVIPGRPRHGEDPCPKCGYELSHPEQVFCTCCGHYDAALRSSGRDSSKGSGGGGGC